MLRRGTSNKYVFPGALIFLFAFCYLMGCFIEVSFNPLNWEREIRIITTLALSLSLVISFVIGILWSIEVE